MNKRGGGFLHMCLPILQKKIRYSQTSHMGSSSDVELRKVSFIQMAYIVLAERRLEKRGNLGKITISIIM